MKDVKKMTCPACQTRLTSEDIETMEGLTFCRICNSNI